MESSVTRPAVDVGPRQARPGLALLLGILAIPGSTVAWDLPAGGLWIGLPLAVAAIYLGLQARRAGEGVGMATTGMVLGALCILQMVVYTIVSVAT